jgi:hypothetical protein
MIHRDEMTGWFGGSTVRISAANDDSLNGALVSPAADGRSTAAGPVKSSKPG